REEASMRKSTLVLIGSVAVLLVGFLIGNIYAQTVKTKREGLYQQFGPRLIEAVVLTMKDEINVLRTKAGLPERTDEQVLDAICAKLGTVQDYDWANKLP
ncbi:MAG: hypothetical protein WCN95_14155, partial [bacterium]